MGSPIQQHRFTVDDLYKMAEVGILTENDHVELIEGEIVEMTPIGSRHAAAVARLTRVLNQVLGTEVLVWVQNPVRLSLDSEPEPDLALLKSKDDFYASGHPSASDVLLLIEVAESSARYDREVKVPLYAGCGIPEVWLVDLEADKIIAYADPENRTYSSVCEFRRGERVTGKLVNLDVDQILGSKRIG